MNFQFAPTSYSVRLADRSAAEVEPVEVLDEIAELVAQRRPLRRQVDEDEALPGLEPDRREAVRLEAEVVEILGVLGPDELALEVVDPGVVRALEADDPAARLLDHGGAAVAADVVEGVQPAVAIADDDEVLAVDLDEQVRARIRGVLLAGDEDPVPAQDLAPLPVEDAGVVIGPLRKQRGGTVLAPDRGQLVRREDAQFGHRDLLTIRCVLRQCRRYARGAGCAAARRSGPARDDGLGGDGDLRKLRSLDQPGPDDPAQLVVDARVGLELVVGGEPPIHLVDGALVGVLRTPAHPGLAVVAIDDRRSAGRAPSGQWRIVCSAMIRCWSAISWSIRASTGRSSCGWTSRTKRRA